MSGANTAPVDCTGQPGVYGRLGTPAAGNVPGGREGAASWIDQSGNFWLFGGYAVPSDGFGDYLNDLWRFDPSSMEWTTKHTFWAHTIERFRAVTATHSILAVRCWFQLLPDSRLCDQFGDTFQNHHLGSILRARRNLDSLPSCVPFESSCRCQTKMLHRTTGLQIGLALADSVIGNLRSFSRETKKNRGQET